MRAFIPLLLLTLGGCTGLVTAGGQPDSLSAGAAGLLGVPGATSASVTSQEISEIAGLAAQIQMLKAQLDGAPMPVLPAQAPQ